MEKMDLEVDHYKVLGLPSGEEGAKLTENEIKKAYRQKALELHPDKRPDDPNAHDNFQKLKLSYEILKDENARKSFDDVLRARRERQVRQSYQNAKRRKMYSDLEERERAASAPDPAAAAQAEEERIVRKFQEEAARIRAMHATKGAQVESTFKRKAEEAVKKSEIHIDEARTLKVSWEKIGEGYSAQRLNNLFSSFGGVEDVVIRHNKKRGLALVVMATKDAAVAATRCVLGDLSNPLHVIPLQPAAPKESASTPQSVESDHLNNLVGAGYKAYEESILEKLKRKAAAAAGNGK